MDSKQYFIKLLSSYINGVKPPEYNDNDIDWNQILYLTNIHSVQAAIFISVDRLDKKPTVYDDLKNSFIAAVNVSAKQEYWMEKVIKKLTENNIDHLLVKGYVLRNYYPDKEARSFGDVDFLIKKEDRERSDKVIKELGFDFDAVGYDKEVWTYKNSALSLEVHTEIIYTELFGDFDYISYFKEKVKNRVLVKGITYEMKKEEHYIYIMVHLAKHFYFYGAGIRMIMDIAVFLNKFKDELDFYYINQELEKLRLSKFANTIHYVCNKYFDIDIECKTVSDFDEKIVMEYVLNYGVFGFENKNPYHTLYYKDGKSKFSVLIEKVFPDYETMSRLNVWFTGKPKILLPYAWARRAFEFAFNKNKLLGKRMEAILTDDPEVERHSILLKSIGLK